jgi:hypothetical protein
MTGAPSTLTVPADTLSVVNQTVSTSSITLDADDQTASYAGWDITASATQFTTGTYTLPTSATSVSSVASAAAGDSCALPTNSITTPVTLGSSAVKIFNAAAGNGSVASGVGGTDVTPTIDVAIPANTRSGSYTSTWTFTIASGP